MNEKPEIIAPIIHRNGSSPSTLIENLERAYDVVSQTIKVLTEIYPHGRDYYPIDGLYDSARNQQDRRIATVRALKEALTQELLLIQEQVDARKRKV